ncbi:YibL family ribosome-associated protein [Zhongshania arctica]|uniref:YibL family ribosome-associated protein n=1 Tax=Zhongshania arctica TaxID=3238302 RepID=A0ABV3TVT7_9GAMM|tara:strand:+ start:5241 stop:5597 length:357 start_codon:yes stop_codon:yes gene_type:complete
MNLNKDIQQLNNKLDMLRRKLDDAKARDDQGLVKQFKRELTTVNKKIASIKGMQSRSNSAQGEALNALPFHRPLSKLEQADMGKFKKSVRGLIVVHPLTTLGKEMGISEVTGYAPKAF